MAILQENGRSGVTGDNPTLTAGYFKLMPTGTPGSLSISIFINMALVHRPEITASEN